VLRRFQSTGACLLKFGGDVMSQKKTATGEYLDPRTMGAMLNINRESVYRAIARGELQAIRVGRSIRLPRAQLDTLLIDGNCDADHQGEQDEW
jgi:excisionase family DNA binding protein